MKNFENRLFGTIRNQYIESGMYSPADYLIEIYIEKYDIPTIVEALYKLLKDNSCIDWKVIGLVQVFKGIEEEYITDDIYKLFEELSKSTNIEILDYIISCFESWITLKSLKILENMNPFKAVFLEKYRLKGIENLKEDLNLL